MVDLPGTALLVSQSCYIDKYHERCAFQGDSSVGVRSVMYSLSFVYHLNCIFSPYCGNVRDFQAFVVQCCPQFHGE